MFFPICCRYSELKLRLRPWETGQTSDFISKTLGQQNSGPLRRIASTAQLQTDEQRGATKGLVGASQGSADCCRNKITTLIPRSSGRNHQCGVCRGGKNCLFRRTVQIGGSRVETDQVSLDVKLPLEGRERPNLEAVRCRLAHPVANGSATSHC